MNHTPDNSYPINTRLQGLINAARAADPFAAYPIATNDIDAAQVSSAVPKATEKPAINHDTQNQ